LIIPNRKKSKDEQIAILKAEFEKDNSLWKIFYKNFNMFVTAFDMELNRIILSATDKKNSDKNKKGTDKPPKNENFKKWKRKIKN
jgi:hypothetical protein